MKPYQIHKKEHIMIDLVKKEGYFVISRHKIWILILILEILKILDFFNLQEIKKTSLSIEQNKFLKNFLKKGKVLEIAVLEAVDFQEVLWMTTMIFLLEVSQKWEDLDKWEALDRWEDSVKWKDFPILTILEEWVEEQAKVFLHLQ